MSRIQSEATRSLRSQYFRNYFSGDIHIDTLESVYKDMDFENNMDVVKMSLVYYTELAMTRKEKTRVNVDKKLFLDVEDLEYFNSMDWGKILWEKTFQRLQRGLKGKVENYKKRSKNNKNDIVK